MKELRIQPDGSVVCVDITCSCGKNCMKADDEREAKFTHRIELGSHHGSKFITCDCGQRFELQPQNTHVHVRELPR